MELSDRPPRTASETAWHEWSLRDEIFAVTQRWQWILICCLVGALLGWLAVQVWPSPHRVSKELFVGLNVYQSKDDHSTGLPFTNANDYKNWQMASLNTIIFTDPVLDDTLRRLRELDPYWDNISREELAEMLSVYWRNAGKWRLVARHETPMYATQAVILWQDAVVETVHTAVAAAQEALQIDEQMKATAASQAELSRQAALLTRIQQVVDKQQQGLSPQAEDNVLSAEARTMLMQALLPVEKLDLDSDFEASFPPPTASVSSYRLWLNALEERIIAQLAAVEIQTDSQERHYAFLSRQYKRAARSSLGLSAELLVQKISDRKLDASVVRPTGVSILVGAALGFLVWVFVWLIRPGLKALH